MPQEIDYTKARKNKRRRIDLCPKCGRMGEILPVEFKTGKSLMVTHKKVFIEEGYLPYWRCTDLCTIRVENG